MALAARSTIRPVARTPKVRAAPGTVAHARRVHHRLPSRADLAVGPALIALTVVLWAATVTDTATRLVDEPSIAVRVVGAALMLVLTFLMASSSMYLLARQGALLRFRDHQPVSRARLDEYFDGSHAAVTVLVPSYAEEVPVVRATLWSAALQEAPRVRVVLLIDDDPHPTDPAAAARLQETRALAIELDDALAVPAARHRLALETFDHRRGSATADATWGAAASADDVLMVALEYEAAARWVEDLAAQQVVDDHVDRFFSERVLGGLARELRWSRPGARCQHCCRSVSPGRSPNPPCGSHRNGLSMVPAVGWFRQPGPRGWGSCCPGSGTW